MKRAYNIGTIELMPYPEHGEFVIVGVFAVDSTRRSLHWRLLQPNRVKRLTQFFPELDRRLFPKVLKDLAAEWERLADMVNKGANTEVLDLNVNDSKRLFRTLTAPREGIVRQTAKATILTDEIEEWVENEFQRMVYRIDSLAASPEEQKLTNEVQNLLNEWKVRKAWKRRTVGNAKYHTTFPFTYQPRGAEQILRAIKPLHLGQNSATKIIDHGDLWLGKVRRLQQFKLAPDLLIFPVERPDPRKAELADRADIVISDLKREGVTVVEHPRFRDLEEYVRIPAEEGTDLFAKGA